MLKAEILRELRLKPGSHPKGKQWLSAASGLVFTQNHLHVVADDELHLGSLAFNPDNSNDHSASLQLVRLLPGELPEDPKARKKAKPDLESLLLLPATSAFAHGALLCLGSGSKSNRQRGLMLPLSSQGTATATEVMQQDLDEWYEPLHQHFDDLNIEGAFISGTTLHLLQRGNKGTSAQSACLLYSADDFMAWLQGLSKPPALKRSISLDFGSVDGVPLCPTDATALPGGGWVSTLVAEDTDNSVADGPCVASALAFIDADFQLSLLHRLEGNPKVEGVTAIPGNSLLMVTDADNPEIPAQLLRVILAI